jgi:Zn finger protein HypA/HybF involved in hydrogenase expression
VNVAPLNRTLDQELTALVRGVSLECLVCGEFLLHVRGALACPECRSILAEGREVPRIELPSAMQAG